MTSSPSLQDRKWLALGLLALAQFVVVLDASIVNVALPSIGSDLHIAEDKLDWVVNAYVLVFGGFLLLGGRIADLLGRRIVFMVGLVLFGIASLVGGFSGSEGTLIAARAVQGLGGALLSPAALSIVTTTFREGSERNKALGVWGAVAGGGGAAGVLLGGVLTDTLGWEWVFFVNTPITLAAAALAPVLIRESHADVERRHFDAFGAVSVTAGLSLLVYAMVTARDDGWGAGSTLGLFAGAAALLVAFLAWERRSPAPLMPFGIFRIRNLSAANLVGILLGASLFSMFFFVSIYMQRVLGYSPLKAGFSYLPLAVTIIISAGVASQLVTKLGFKRVLIFGLLCVTAGLLLFSQIDANGSFASDVLPASLLAALGLGFSFVPVTIASQAGVRGSEAGLASGLITTSQQIGGALGLAILSTVAASRTDGAFASGAAPPVALTEGFQNAFIVGACFAVVGALLALVLVREKQLEEDAEAGLPVEGEIEPERLTSVQ
jgi:EmrB/QacA subfamily drug resistance transporter